MLTMMSPARIVAQAHRCEVATVVVSRPSALATLAPGPRFRLARALLSRRPMSTAALARIALAIAVLAPLGCDHTGAHEPSGGLTSDVGKGDGAAGVEIVGMLVPGAPQEGVLPSKSARLGHLVFATEGTALDVEITRAGTASKLDTVLTIHGPRDASGAYAETLASDDDDGYGKLSRLRDVVVEREGFYLVEVALAAGSAAITDKPYRIALDCTGTCRATGPVVQAGLDVRWVQRSAEYRAAAIMAFTTAGQRLATLDAAGELPERWAIISDVDDTLLDNSPYQRERQELGTGYSASSWAKWVARKEARAVPGAVAFARRVHELGGEFVIVTNRSAAECADTETNLQAVGIAYDRIVCKAKSGGSDKNPRFAAVEAGDAEHAATDVVLFVGDNIQDFPGLGQELRHEGEDAFADFGGELVIIPNPMYGSWTSNPD